MRSRLCFLLFLFLVFVLGCNSKKGKITDEKTGYWYEVTSQHHEGNFYPEDIYIGYNEFVDGQEGILFTYHLASEKGEGLLGFIFGSLPYDAYTAFISVEDENKKSLADTTAVLKKIYRNRIEKSSSFFIPHASLALGKGRKEIVLKWSGYPSAIDTTMSTGTTEERIKTIRKSPDATCEIKLSFYQNEIFKASVQVKSFEIDKTKADVHAFDYRLFGPGYPDLFWTAKLGNQVIFTTQVLHNHIVFDSVFTTPFFRYGIKDSIKILVWDHDDLSRPDLVGIWNHKVSIIPAYTYGESVFDSVTNFKIRLIKK